MRLLTVLDRVTLESDAVPGGCVSSVFFFCSQEIATCSSVVVELAKVSDWECAPFAAVLHYNGFASRLLGNTLWTVALGYYFYITFLGYSGECYDRRNFPHLSYRSKGTLCATSRC